MLQIRGIVIFISLGVLVTACFKYPDAREALSGVWRPIAAPERSTNPPIISYQLKGNRLLMNSSDGRTFDALLDGTDTPIEGPGDRAVVSVRPVDAQAFWQVTKRDGRPISVQLITVADGQITSFIDIQNGRPISVRLAVRDQRR